MLPVEKTDQNVRPQVFLDALTDAFFCTEKKPQIVTVKKDNKNNLISVNR